MNDTTFTCHKISEGFAEGEVLISTDDIMFYLIDPQTGVVIEKGHSLEGKSVSGKILIFPGGKGSSVVQADGMYQLSIHNNAPKAMIIENPETVLVASAIIMEMPMVDRLPPEFYKQIGDGDGLRVDANNGLVTKLSSGQNWVGGAKLKPLIWIIDEEWPDYLVEVEMLKHRYPDCTIKFSSYDYGKDLEEFGHRADMILCQIYASIPGDVIRKLQNCKGIAVYGGGYDRVDVTTAREMGISVTNVSDYCKEDVADYVIACIYHFNKQILSYEKAMKEGQWGAQAVRKKIRRIKGLTLLTIGLGRIGKAVAEKGNALGMKVIAYDPYVDNETMRPLAIEKVSWENGLRQADFISLSPILNNETEGLIKYEDFMKMKKTAYLINTARGKIVVEQDLIRAVQEGCIAGAALDVIGVEPPTLKEAVFNCQGIVVTPHISYISEESYSELKRRTVQNAMDMFEDRTPVDLVN